MAGRLPSDQPDLALAPLALTPITFIFITVANSSVGKSAERFSLHVRCDVGCLTGNSLYGRRCSTTAPEWTRRWPLDRHLKQFGV